MKRRIGYLLLALLILTGIYGFLAYRARPLPAHPFFAELPAPRVIAHQGGEELWPSNTMLAFQNAVDLGVDVLEMDIHATEDGVLIVMHDDTVDRTTDGSGTIKEMTWEKIAGLDAGHYWSDDGGQSYPFRGQGVRVPRLDEVFAAFPDVPMDIEIKPADPSIVTPFCRLLREYERTSRTLVASFHDETVIEMRAVCPEVATSLVRAEIETFWGLQFVGLDALYPAPGYAIQVPERSSLPLIGEVQVITERFVRSAHRHNVEVYVWTIDDVADMERLLALGVDGIITDRPDLLLEVVGR